MIITPGELFKAIKLFKLSNTILSMILFELELYKLNKEKLSEN